MDAPSVAAYCESFPNLALSWKFPTPVVVASALFAHSLTVTRRLPFSLRLPHPPPFLSISNVPTPPVCFLLSRRIVVLWERKKDIASIGVLVRVCGRWRLLWQGESEVQGWRWGTELRRIHVNDTKCLSFFWYGEACVLWSDLSSGSVGKSHFFVSVSVRASVFSEQLSLLADCCCGVSGS